MLLLVLVVLQYRIWVGDGIAEVWRMRQRVEQQEQANAEQLERNQRLAAEVLDLKNGLAAIEEHARFELGMIGTDETFYMLVE